MSARYEEIRARYLRGWMTKEQLHRYAELGVITQGEYTDICGEAY